MVDHYFAEYASYHTDRRNLVCHEIGIPLIVWSIFSLLELVKLGPLDLGMVVGALVILFYVRLDVRLGLIALVAFAGLYLAGKYTPWWLAVAAFTIGWIFQFMLGRLLQRADDPRDVFSRVHRRWYHADGCGVRI